MRSPRDVLGRPADGCARPCPTVRPDRDPRHSRHEL